MRRVVETLPISGFTSNADGLSSFSRFWLLFQPEVREKRFSIADGMGSESLDNIAAGIH
jgi:hypothetical protein